MQYRNYISDICDKLPSKYNDEEILIYSNRAKYVEKVSNEIIEYCNTLNEEIVEEEEYISKYDVVDFDGKSKKIFILVSGCPDSGKTTFSRILASKIKDSICFDSDILLEKDLLAVPLDRLVSDNNRVVVFSDIYADRFFSDEELSDSIVINIYIKPISIERMHQHSKYMQHIPFEEYKKCEIETIKCSNPEEVIYVTNDYSKQILKQADNTIDKILEIIKSYNESVITLKNTL